MNLERRFQWALQGYSQTQFFYGALEGIFYDPAYSGVSSIAISRLQRGRVRGGTAFGIYPFNRYRRVEFYGGLVELQGAVRQPGVEELSDEYQEQQFGRTLFNNGTMMPLGVTFIQETTVFREFGPLAGSTDARQLRRARRRSASSLSRQTIDVDARKYLRLGGSGLLAAARQGIPQLGPESRLLVFRRQLRDARLRLLVVRRAGRVLPEHRTALPADRGDGDAGRHSRRHSRDAVRQPRRRELGQPGVQGVDHQHHDRNADHRRQQTSGNAGHPDLRTAARDQRLPTASMHAASYGISLQTFALGFPIHFDWSWRTLFSREWEDVVYLAAGGSDEFRKPKFTMWIGYDF